MTPKNTKQIIVARPLNRVIRYKGDMVGNDLTAVLRWCDTHDQPVWQYNDGSFSCPHDLIIQGDTGPHELVDGPWEAS